MKIAPHHRDYHIFLIILLAYSLCAYAAALSSPELDNCTVITDLSSDPCVKMVADYAVKEYNIRTGAELKLLKIIGGCEQLVSGILYRLDLRTLLDWPWPGKTTDYEATVWVKTWEHFKNLTSFKPIPS